MFEYFALLSIYLFYRQKTARVITSRVRLNRLAQERRGTFWQNRTSPKGFEPGQPDKEVTTLFKCQLKIIKISVILNVHCDLVSTFKYRSIVSKYALIRLIIVFIINVQ